MCPVIDDPVPSSCWSAVIFSRFCACNGNARGCGLTGTNLPKPLSKDTELSKIK